MKNILFELVAVNKNKITDLDYEKINKVINNNLS